jgi:hypothetical protein
MKKVTVLYTCDLHHNNKELIGVFTTKGNAIKATHEKASQEDEFISEDDLYNLERINQTQGYTGFGEFIIEELELNKLQ